MVRGSPGVVTALAGGLRGGVGSAVERQRDTFRCGRVGTAKGQVSKMQPQSTPPERRRLQDKLLELIDRHGDQYLEEGKHLVRRLRRTVLLVGFVIAAAVAVVAAVIIYAVLR